MKLSDLIKLHEPKDIFAIRNQGKEIARSIENKSSMALTIFVATMFFSAFSGGILGLAVFFVSSLGAAVSYEINQSAKKFEQKLSDPEAWTALWSKETDLTKKFDEITKKLTEASEGTFLLRPLASRMFVNIK